MTRPGGCAALPELLALADREVAQVVRSHADRWGATVRDDELDPGWVDAYRNLLAAEAWREHGAWLAGRLDALGADVRGRFETASRMTPDMIAQARVKAIEAQAQVRELIGDRVLVLPSASSVAPVIGSDLTAVRDRTLRLTCLAGLGGLPAVTVPSRTPEGLPCGVCLVGPPGSDRDLLALAQNSS